MIDFKNLSFSYGNLKVFDNLNLACEDNKITCIVGPSGCGKTTLLNIISGGNKNIGDQDIFFGGGKLSGERLNLVDDISYVFQEHRLILEKTVRENLNFILKQIYLDKAQRKKQIDYFLDMFALEEAADKYPSELSGGMAQRVTLSRAFAFPSKVLLMDEPFKGLDIKLKQDILKSFCSLYESDKRTTVFVTHNIEEALLIGDKICIFSDKPVAKIKTFLIEEKRGARKLYSPLLTNLKNEIYKQMNL